MRTSVTSDPKQLADYRFRRVRIDLGEARIEQEEIACADAEDFLGGIGRAFKSLAEHDVSDAYAPAAPLIMNLGVFSGTELMTGLRVFFSAYSPLKAANNGQPLAMWSTASGKFGTKMLAAGVDEVVFVGRAARPVYLLIRNDNGNLSLSLEDAGDLVGQTTHDKIMQLADRHADAHVAALGPAGENWQHNAYAAIACSTVNQLQSRQCKPRFAGRGGMGSVMGSKNLLAVVAQAPDLKRGKLAAEVREANKEISRGEGSRNYRDAKKANGAGGTWRNVAGLHPLGALPETNFWPQGDDSPSSLYRSSMEEPYLIKDESCYQCGIACHKNIYDVDESDGRRRAGKFYAKFDYEPLDLMTINLGIYDQQQALDLVELVDQLGFDSISLGVTLGYAMDYNRQHPEQAILGGLSFGDFAATCDVIRQAAAGGARRSAWASNASRKPSAKPTTPCTARAWNCPPTCRKPTPATRSPSPAATCRCAPSCCSSSRDAPNSTTGWTPSSTRAFTTRATTFWACANSPAPRTPSSSRPSAACSASR